ncbi:hypothetical protein GQF42_04175 [Streptomyces broussonetiae]|uniref:Uncharacterized protein n=1 Tax=Streptomyces broussonetiae TaxID=2686304 RepID=A0A6I6MSZ7_9ACTN|nr:hypothetical protein [Streptomyces broussonetiae]QHA02592.1 hypothetical protein GQF42_04175 [Streptomyces broussonetiae]
MIVLPHAADDAAPFHELFAAHLRLASLALSPDGTRRIVSVQSVNDERTRRVSRLWAVDPSCRRESRRGPADTGTQGEPRRARHSAMVNAVLYGETVARRLAQ